jgi:hypothetical protein
MPVPPPQNPRRVSERKISEMIGEAIIEDEDARREGLLTLADHWIDLADRRKAEETPPPDRNCD